MEAGGRADEIRVALEGRTAGELRVFEILEGGEVLVDQGRVGQRPEGFGGLQFGRVRWQKEHVHLVRHPQLDAGVPTGAIQHEHDLLGGTRTDVASELGQLHFEQRDAHRGGQVKDGAAWRPEAGWTKPTR